MKRTIKALAVVAVLSFIAGPALADDFMPPTLWWTRGGPLTVTAEWEFLTASNPITPDGPLTDLSNANGGWSTQATISGGSGENWESGDGDGQWNFPGGGTITVDLNNIVDFEPDKLLWIQITYCGTAPTVSNIVAEDNEVSMGVTVTEIANYDPAAGNHVEFWKIEPNPDWETIYISVPECTTVDQIVIDTISPEPSVMALLGMGGVAVLIRRRRRQ